MGIECWVDKAPIGDVDKDDAARIEDDAEAILATVLVAEKWERGKVRCIYLDPLEHR